MANAEHNGTQPPLGQKDLNALNAALEVVAELRHASVSHFSMRMHESIILAINATKTGRMRYSEQGKVVVGSEYLFMLKKGLWIGDPRDLLERISSRLIDLRSQVSDRVQEPVNGS